MSTMLVVCLLLGSFYNGPSSDLILLTLAWSLVAAFLVFCRSQTNPQQTQLPTDIVSMFFILYMIVVFFSGFFSTAPNNTNIVRWTYLLGPALYLLWRSHGSRNAWQSLWPCLFGFGVLSALFGIFDFWRYPELNVSGQREDPNTYADLLLAILTPATMMYLNSSHMRPLTRRSYELGMLLIALALILSDSRAGLLIWATSSILLLTYLTVKGKLQLKRLAAVSGVFAVAWFIFLLLPATIESYSGLLSAENDPVNIRMLMWKSSWEMYLQRPILGSGLGTFGMYYESFRSPQEFITSGMNPHNDFLQILIEGGPVLLLFVLGFGLVALVEFVKMLVQKQQTHPEFSAIQYSLLVVVLGMLAHALINFTITTLVLSMFACLYLAIALQDRNSASVQPLKNLQPKAATAVLVVGIVLPVSILWLDTVIDNIYNPSSRSHQTIALIDQQNAAKMYRAANILGALRPNNIYPKNYRLQQTLATFNNNSDPFQRRQLSAHIVNQYHAMKQACQPCDFLYRNLGMHFRQLGKDELANQEYLSAIELAPTTIKNYLEYADFLAANGKYAEAMSMLLVEIERGMPIITKRSGKNSAKIIVKSALNLAKRFGTETEVNHLNGRLLAMEGQITPE